MVSTPDFHASDLKFKSRWNLHFLIENSCRGSIPVVKLPEAGILLVYIYTQYVLTYVQICSHKYSTPLFHNEIKADTNQPKMYLA